MDLYSLLGVTRSASADDIERAYRRLARRYHPGINPGDRVAEDLYRQILEAYGVLGNPDSRRDYDRVGQVGTTAVSVAATLSFEGFDFSTPAEGASAATFSEMFSGVFQQAARRATGPEAGGAIEAELDVPFEDAMRGGAFPLSVVRQERCLSCAGDGRQARPPVVCPDCRGEGQRRWARGHMVFAAPCEVCGGAGQVTWQRMPDVPGRRTAAAQRSGHACSCRRAWNTTRASSCLGAAMRASQGSRPATSTCASASATIRSSVGTAATCD